MVYLVTNSTSYMSPKHPQFGTFLASRRRELGLSMGQVAEQLGIAKSNVHNYEKGEWLPKADKMYALAKALDLPYEDLLAAAGMTHPESLPALQPYLRAKYRDLPDEAVREAEAFFSELQERYGHGGGHAESNK